MKILLRPLDRYPKAETPRHQRATGAAFKATIGSTIYDLKAELEAINATNVVLEIEIAERDIARSDGWLKADARPKGPRIVLGFESKHGPLRYACDTYQYWEANLRAITLTLKALRAINRYGAAATGEQYRGWLALPGAGGTGMTRESAALIIAEYGMMGVSSVLGPRPADLRQVQQAANLLSIA